jgi:IS5 family transposase
MHHGCAALGEPVARVRHRLRSVGRRVIAIRLQSRREESRPALVRSYRRLMSTTRAVVREATTMIRRIAQRARTFPTATARRLQGVQRRLQQLRPLVARVVGQTRARVLGGDCYVPDKVLSVFEPHTEAIRKGKHAKPTEFGKLVIIQEAEHQIISAYARPAARRPGAVDAVARSPHHDLWTAARPRDRGSGLFVGGQ